MSKFITLRTYAVEYSVDAWHVNVDRIIGVRRAVEGDDWFKHSLTPGMTAPASVVAVNGLGNIKSIETVEQVLDAIKATNQ